MRLRHIPRPPQEIAEASVARIPRVRTPLPQTQHGRQPVDGERGPEGRQLHGLYGDGADGQARGDGREDGEERGGEAAATAVEQDEDALAG